MLSLFSTFILNTTLSHYLHSPESIIGNYRILADSLPTRPKLRINIQQCRTSLLKAYINTVPSRIRETRTLRIPKKNACSDNR